MLKEEQKSDSLNTQNPSQKDYEQKFYDREFADIQKNYADEVEHPLEDKESLADKEKSAESKKPSDTKKNDGGAEKSFYNSTADDDGLSSKLTKRGLFKNKKATGGALGAFLAIVAAIIIGINTLGPLQFIHFAQMLHSFHLSDQEYNGNSRIRKLIIYAKNNGDTSKTRLGVLESKYSSKIDAKLAKNGWNIDFTSSGSVFNGFTYDPNKIDGDGKLSAEEMKSKLEAEGVKNVQVKDGKVTVPPDSMKYWSNKSLIKQIYSGSSRDIGRITGAFEKRILIKRSGISLNPITKLDQKINQKIGDYIKEERAKRLAGQAPNPDVTTRANVDADNPDNTNESAAGEAQQGVNDAKSGKLKSAADISFKGAAGLGIVCAVKAISDGASEAKKLNATIPLIQASAEVLAVGSKSQDGGDVSMKVLSEYSKSLYGRTEDNKSSWSEASTLQYEQTGDVQGTRLPDEFNPGDQETGLTSFFASIPLLGEVCSAVTSTVGSILISIATGGLVTVVSDQIIDKLIAASGIFNTLITYLAGEAPNLADPAYAGAVYGEAANVGTRLLANETSSTMGGRVLSDSEELALNTAVKNEKVAEYKNKPIAEKYLNPYEYDTPVAKAIDTINPDTAPKTIANLPHTVFASITAPFSKKVSAAEDTKPSEVYYGNKKVGFAAGSLDAPELENPYDNAEKARKILNSDSKYVDWLKECNRVIVLDLPNGLDFQTEEGTGEAPVLLDQTKLGEHCYSDDDNNFLIVRTAAFDTMKMKGLACIEFDDTESCDDIGLSDGALGAKPAFKVMSFNMNAEMFDDDHPDHKWDDRKATITTVVNQSNVDILGAQEIFSDDMYNDLKAMFPEYGMTSDTGGASRNPILFKNSAFLLEKEGFKDLTSNRYMSWAILKSTASNNRLLIVNTHFEVDNLPLATDQAKMVLDEIKKINTENLMVIVTGDFNSGPAVGPPVSFKNAGYTHTKEGATTKTNEDYSTFNGYEPPDEGRHIDYIFVKNNTADVTIDTFEVLIDTPGGVIPSDHNAIVTGLIFAGAEDGASAVVGGNPSLSCTEPELSSKEIYWPVKDPAPINSHDLPKPVGTPVYAITSGVVVESKDLVGCDGRKCGDGMYSYGRVIKIDHGLPRGIISYAHLSERQVEKGDRVAAGQQIALSGNSGNSYGPHLHVDFNNGSYTTIAWLRTKNPINPKGDICTQ